MTVEHKSLFEKRNRQFLTNEDKYNDTFVSWYVSCDEMHWTSGDSEEVKTDVDMFSDLTISNGRQAISFGNYAGDRESAIKELQSVEALIAQLVNYAEAVTKAVESLPEKKES